MNDHQQRIIEEQDELIAKLLKLLAFTSTSTYRTLAAIDRSLLDSQLHTMIAYNLILAKRIARFGN